MPRRIDLEGQRFGRLQVVSHLKNSIFRGDSTWVCRCDCGAELLVRSASLRNGATKSCGCLRNDVVRNRMRTHGLSNTRVYGLWQSMVGRCHYPGNSSYHRYGARGISVCERWLIFENFLADMGEPPPGLSLDRIDNNGPYSPENCRWTDIKTQLKNRRNTRFLTHNGITKTIAEWGTEIGLSGNQARNLYTRLKYYGNDSNKVLDPRRHPTNPTQLLMHNGATHTLSEWASKIGIHPATLYKRLKRYGDDLDKVLQPSTRPYPSYRLTYQGQTKNIAEWAQELGMTVEGIYRRLKVHGHDPDKVLRPRLPYIRFKRST